MLKKLLTPARHPASPSSFAKAPQNSMRNSLGNLTSSDLFDLREIPNDDLRRITCGDEGVSGVGARFRKLNLELPFKEGDVRPGEIGDVGRRGVGGLCRCSSKTLKPKSAKSPHKPQSTDVSKTYATRRE